MGLPDPGTELILVLLKRKRKTNMATDGFLSPIPTRKAAVLNQT